MSKRSKGQSMMYQGAKQKKNALVKSGPRTGSKPVSKGTARVYERPAKTSLPVSPDNILRMRIAAGVIAVLALAGAVYWVASTRSAYTPGVIIGLVALGFVAGLMIFAALRAESVLRRMGNFALGPRRR